VVILDMNMPGLGGAATLPHLRRLHPDLPILLATGRVDQTALALAAAHPRVVLLPKPFQAKDLSRHLTLFSGG
jgi:CheY-like chemotaxis protein